MKKANKSLVIIFLIIVLATILGFLWFARSTMTFPVIRTEEQAERNIKTLYFYDEDEYKNSELEVVDSCENDEFVLYAFRIDDKFGYVMYEFMSLGRVDQNGCVVTTDDYMVEVMTYNDKSYMVMMHKDNIGKMITHDKNSGKQIEFECNGHDTIAMWEFENEPEITYDVYDGKGNLIVENEAL